MSLPGRRRCSVLIQTPQFGSIYKKDGMCGSLWVSRADVQISATSTPSHPPLPGHLPDEGHKAVHPKDTKHPHAKCMPQKFLFAYTTIGSVRAANYCSIPHQAARITNFLCLAGLWSICFTILSFLKSLHQESQNVRQSNHASLCPWKISSMFLPKRKGCVRLLLPLVKMHRP